MTQKKTSLYEITFNNETFKIASHFIDYLHHKLYGSDVSVFSWHEQVKEQLVSNEYKDMQQKIRDVFKHRKGQQLVSETLNAFTNTFRGNLKGIEHLIGDRRFLMVVGIPRSGGTYVVKEIVRALGMDYRRLHSGLIHDAFPALGAIQQEYVLQKYSKLTYSVCQYLSMAKLHADTNVGPASKWIPKKCHTFAYEMEAVDSLFGKSAEYYITIRHPAASARSTIDKSGGIPSNRRVPRTRSNIEQQMVGVLMNNGYSSTQINKMDYNEVYLEYWTLFYANMFRHGELQSGAAITVLPYGPAAMNQMANDMHTRFETGLAPEEFVVKPTTTQIEPFWSSHEVQDRIQYVRDQWKLSNVELPHLDVI